MNPSDALAQHRIARAHAALHEADLLIEQQLFSGDLNRVYYAAFYAARALLATRNLDSSRHSGVIGLFQEHFVRTGLVPTETARALARAFEKRQTSDRLSKRAERIADAEQRRRWADSVAPVFGLSGNAWAPQDFAPALRCLEGIREGKR